MKRFVLIAELEKDGYFLGEYETLEVAKHRQKEYWDVINFTNQPLNELSRFEVKEEMSGMRQGLVYGSTNGFFYVYIVDNSIVE